MVPKFNAAFRSGVHVRTGGGSGRTRIRNLADAFLPTGRVTLGFPSINSITNQPLRVEPEITPGRYPILASYIRKKGKSCGQVYTWTTFVCVTIIVSREKTACREYLGGFFTDSGDGCIVDQSLERQLRAQRQEDWENRSGSELDRWRRIRDETKSGGDGVYRMDERNYAIAFRALDWSYDCYLGRDKNHQITNIVIDGRCYRPWDFSIHQTISQWYRDRTND